MKMDIDMATGERARAAASPALEAAVRRFKLRQLQLLVAIGEHANLHRAAEAVHISQPAASKLLAQVEEAVGTSLFERLPRGLRPTAAGDALLRRAGNIVAELSAAGEELAAIASGRGGRVRLGSIVGAVPGLISATAVSLHRASDPIALSLVLGTSGTLLAALRERRLDLVVGRIPVTSERHDLSFEFLVDERQVVVCRADHPIATRAADLALRNLELRRLMDGPWVVHPPGSVLHARFEDMLRRAGLPSPVQAIETDSVDITINLLLAGDFLAVLPRNTVAPWIERGFLAVLPVELSLDLGAVGIITLIDRPLSRAAERVVEGLRRHAQAGEGQPSEP